MHKLSTFKNMLLLAVVACPLFILMLENFHDAMSVSAAPEPKSPEKLPEKPVDYVALVRSARERVADELPGAQKLSSADLFGDPPLPDLTIPGLDPAYWPKVKQARDTIDAFAKIYRRRGPLEPEAEKKQLQPFSATEPWAGLHEAQPLQDWIALRIDTLTVQIQNKELLEKARQDLKDKKYTTCLASLEKLNGPALSPEQSQDVESWTKAARFEEFWAFVPEKNSARRVKELEAKLKNSPVFYNSDSEQRAATWKQELNTRKVDMRRVELFDKPPQLLDKMLDQCQALTRDDPAILEKVQADFRGWIKTRIIEHKIKADKDHRFDKDLKEAWTIKDERIEGVFDRAGLEGDENKLYKLYDLKDWLRKPRGVHKREIYLQQLQGEPKPLLEPRVIAEYNKLRNDFLTKLDSKSAWETFATRAGGLQQELTEYLDRRREEPENRTSFQDSVDFAQQAIQRWDVAEEFLATK